MLQSHTLNRAIAALTLSLALSCRASRRPTRPACRRTCRRSPARRTTSTSGRSASRASATAPTSSSPWARTRSRADYGKVVSSVSVGGRHEAHHGGFTDDRRQLWVGGLDDERDLRLRRRRRSREAEAGEDDRRRFEKDSGVVGPHGFYALPGRMLVHRPLQREGPRRPHRHGRVQQRRRVHPHDLDAGRGAAYGYDARVQPRLNRMLTSSFTGWKNYMLPLGELMGDAEAMKHFGSTHGGVGLPRAEAAPDARRARRAARDPLGAAARPRLRVHRVRADVEALAGRAEAGRHASQATAVADIGDPSKTPLPVDISLSADDRFLFVDTFMDGKVRVFDVSDPHQPKLVHEQKIGRQVNMVSQTWDGKRVYFTSSLLANWDKSGDDNEQFLKAYAWDGKKLAPAFAIDFQGRGPRAPAPHALRPEELLREPAAGGRARFVKPVRAIAGLWPRAWRRGRRSPRPPARRRARRASALGSPVIPGDAAYTFGIGAFAPDVPAARAGQLRAAAHPHRARPRRRRLRGARHDARPRDRRPPRDRLLHLRNLQSRRPAAR